MGVEEYFHIFLVNFLFFLIPQFFYFFNSLNVGSSNGHANKGKRIIRFEIVRQNCSLKCRCKITVAPKNMSKIAIVS